MTTTTSEATTYAPVGFLLRKLDRLINEQFERTLGRYEVTRRQWQLLSTLSQGPASTDSLTEAIAPFLDEASGETARPHLDSLTERGLVGIHGGAYSLTTTGRNLFRTLATEVQATRQLTVAGMADAEYEATCAGLQKMIRNLEQDR